jgi:hypothetical protein
MTLDQAVGTTFSLDLHALLLAPVTFALFDAHLAEEGEPSDPLAVLEAVRRHAANIDLFCQAGQIGMPQQYQPIVAHLEDSVHPCAVRRAHRIFHPKVWALRFADPQTGALAYRLLVLSRNLTFSRSWDTVVALDGRPSKDAAASPNGPLADLIRHLPELSVRDSDRFDRVRAFADDLLTVEWTLPDGFTDIEFLAFGVPGHTPTLPDADRLLVLAPFASGGRLATLVDSANGEVLVSRPETLDRISGDVLDRYASVYTLSPSAADAEDNTEQRPTDEALAERVGEALVGLHAKLFITERGWNTTMVTGSPNATDAAFDGNVEFAVALTGPRKLVGIKAFLGDDAEEGSMIRMLDTYRRDDPEPIETTDAEKVAARLDELGRRIAQLAFTVSIEEHDETTYQARLGADRPLPELGQAEASVRLLSQRPVAAVALSGGGAVSTTFSGLSLESVTSFVVVELTAASEEGMIANRVVVNARLTGAPEDRHQRILTAQLGSKGDVLRYLLFLLADMGDEGAAAQIDQFVAQIAGDGNVQSPSIPLFESMVRALNRSPQSLDHIGRLIADLERTEEGRKLLPEGLSELWPAIWEARQQVAR